MKPPTAREVVQGCFLMLGIDAFLVAAEVIYRHVPIWQQFDEGFGTVIYVGFAILLAVAVLAAFVRWLPTPFRACCDTLKNLVRPLSRLQGWYARRGGRNGGSSE